MKRLLTLCALLAGLTTQAQLPSYVPTDGLVGYWGFNGNANDESGNGNDGTVNGATVTEDRFGNPNSAYDFDGVDDFISIQDAASLSLNGDFTISAWKFESPNSTNAYHSIVTKRLVGDWSYNLSVSKIVGGTNQENDKLVTGRRNNGGAQYELRFSDEITDDDVWQHVLVTVKNDTIRFYIDGLDAGHLEAFGNTFTIPMQNQLVGLTIGDCNCNNNEEMQGSLDEIGIWNRALTEEEVLVLYNGCSVSIETIAGDLTPFTLEENTYNCTNTPNSTFEWEVEGGVITSGQGSSTVTVLWAEEGMGTLTVTETTEAGCEGSVSIEVEIVCATTATTIEGPLGPGELLEVTYTCDGDASSTYNWSISNGVITSGQGTNTVSVIWASTGLGSITVQETTSANCDGEEITLDVVVVVATRINETLKESINIFPNPASTSVTISIDESLINASYQLFDARGKLVSEGA